LTGNGKNASDGLRLDDNSSNNCLGADAVMWSAHKKKGNGAAAWSACTKRNSEQYPLIHMTHGDEVELPNPHNSPLTMRVRMRVGTMRET